MIGINRKLRNADKRIRKACESNIFKNKYLNSCQSHKLNQSVSYESHQTVKSISTNFLRRISVFSLLNEKEIILRYFI